MGLLFHLCRHRKNLTTKKSMFVIYTDHKIEVCLIIQTIVASMTIRFEFSEYCRNIGV